MSNVDLNLTLEDIFLKFEKDFKAEVGKPLNASSFKAFLDDKQENKYKDLPSRARDILDVDSWTEEMVESGKILEKVKRAVKESEGLALWPSKNKQLFDEFQEPKIGRIFYNLYKNKVSDEESFDTLVGRNVFGKNYKLLSYLFFIKDEEKYCPVAPESFDEIFHLLGVPFATNAKASWDNYYEFYIPKIKEFSNYFHEKLGGAFSLLDIYCFLQIRKGKHTTKKLDEPKPKGKNISMKDSTLSLNTIFYGPPGTGKTYHTVDKALEICGVDTSNMKRPEVKREFQKLVDSGRIIFTTFHQSMTYEDFIEGIKPILNDEEDENSNLAYELKDGIFKRLAIKASFEYLKESKKQQIIDFSSAYNKFIGDVLEKLEQDIKPEYEIKTQDKKLIITEITKHDNIIAKHSSGDRSYTISKDRLSLLYEKLEMHDKLENFDNISNISETIRGMIKGCNATLFWAILNELRKNYLRKSPTPGAEITYDDKKRSVEENKDISVYNDHSELDYVLIIDEINRGNVSEIFGELITLIEDDKRLGKEEVLLTELPYSKKRFGIPANLHIIGTMNTADRSVEALDTALRRRFSFEEIMPDPEMELLKGKEIDGINISDLLKTINERIETLVDRDHMIGHSYFIAPDSIDDLKKVFEDKIIPLLQEYFYGDYGKIGLVLGKGFIEAKDATCKFADYDYNFESELDEIKLFKIKKLKDSNEFESAIQKLLNKSNNDTTKSTEEA